MACYIACVGCKGTVDSLDEFAIAHMKWKDGTSANRYYCAKCWKKIKAARNGITPIESDADGRFPDTRSINIMRCEGCNRYFDTKDGWGAFDWHSPYMVYGCEKVGRFRMCLSCMETMISATEGEQ